MEATQGGTGTTTDAPAEGEDEESSSSSSTPGVQQELSLGSLFDDQPKNFLDSFTGSGSMLVDENVGSKRNVAQELNDFRVQWKAELTKRRFYHQQTGYDDSSKNNSGTLSPSPEPARVVGSSLDAPISLYRQGIAYEQRGLMHEAVRCYRHAIHLVPDIEKHFYHLQQKKAQRDAENSAVAEGNETVSGNDYNADEILSIEERIAFFETHLYCDDVGRKVYCFIDKEQSYHHNNRHVSDLPTEVLLNIFKWVVSSDLDLRQLEQLSLVCRGFYVLAREVELWKLACLRLWGLRLGTLEDNSIYTSWRDMYLNRPHPLFHGLYISRMTYIRHGESTFQDYNYRPWHMVVYYRYIRFFADGTVLMVTTPDEPQMVVGGLKTKHPQHTAALKGTYHFLDKDCIGAILKRPKRNWNDSNNIISYFSRRRNQLEPSNDSEQIFNLVLKKLHKSSKV